MLGNIVAGRVLYLIASGKAGLDVASGFAANGFDAHSPGGYPLLSVLICEIVMTAMFLLIIGASIGAALYRFLGRAP